MRRARLCVAPRFLAFFLALALALAPVAAQARAGGGASFGGRGSRTYSAPPATRTAPGYAAPLRAAPGYRPYNSGGVGLMHGIMGGLLGAGLIGLLFGHGLFGHGAGGLLGALIQIAIIVFVVRWLLRRFAGGGVLTGGGGVAAGMAPPGMTMAPPPAPVAALALQQSDFRAFEGALQQVQAAWSAGDIATLQRLATQDMVATFASQLQELRARGLRNEVSDVHLVEGDLSEAWHEGGADFATVAMRFSMIDVTRDATGRVVDGAPGEHVQATELWTFTRPVGGAWLLSAIQQTG